MRTMKNVAGLLLCFVCAPALALGLEPGEWQFDTITTSPGNPKPQTYAGQRCVTKEEAANAEKWAGQKLAEAGCRLVTKNSSSNSVTWDVDCPKTGWRGTSVARIGRGTMESEMHMTGEMQGRKFEMTAKTSGKRLGPCKT